MTFLSVPQDARTIIHILIKQNPHLKLDTSTIDDQVDLSGSALPNLPGCLKSGAIASAGFAVFGAIAEQIGQLRYKSPASKISINTDHASYFLAMVFLFRANGHSLLKNPQELIPFLPRAWDRRATLGPLEAAVTNTYITKDNRYYQLHGGLNPNLVLHTLGLLGDNTAVATTPTEASEIIAQRIKELDSQELETLMIENRHSGNMCHSPEEWRASAMGQALDKRPLYDVELLAAGRPCGFPTSKNNKILEGIKVIEFARIIAGPTIGYLLASLGAQVIKINAPHLDDLTELQFTLTVGKHTVALNAKNPKEKTELENLVGQADVFINGYRPGSLERLGFGKEHVQALVKQHQGEQATVVYADESCYGINGPYKERSGWEQTSDAASGVSYLFGHSIGLSRPRIPVLPVTDHLTGLFAATSILCALRDRATIGGSYHVVASLTKSNMFQLSPEVGVFSQETMDKAQEKYQWPQFTTTMDMASTIRTVIRHWQNVHPQHLDFDDPGSFTSHFDQSEFFATKDGNGDDRKRVPVDLLAPVIKIDGYPSGWESPPRPFGIDPPSFDY
ncbi:CoA-transferase family III domain-containing protein [Absidia repens]|uniref:CoA-transferase family III domain-containing protein n=1 Tax=Absidia repens TaxID=90262 RepID=A0A1X2I8Q0_9FUNG|nr:CoA-transferase family III domain-containing protein [Absidia repens]